MTPERSLKKELAWLGSIPSLSDMCWMEELVKGIDVRSCVVGNWPLTHCWFPGPSRYVCTWDKLVTLSPNSNHDVWSPIFALITERRETRNFLVCAQIFGIMSVCNYIIWTSAMPSERGRRFQKCFWIFCIKRPEKWNRRGNFFAFVEESLNC